ncbi:unnamed protein product [Leptidea sinapis]|uniref:Uncharacterized protein n=1 Tax=Leptidea sinapis TaxID=189913 RepID=A0A5E4Q452_9NEOP|nr:unnamed protein product [Leptidea sinapis]
MECQKCSLGKDHAFYVRGSVKKLCKRLAADLKAGKNRIYCNNCEDDDSEIEENEADRGYDKILKDIRNVQALPALIKQIDSIKSSMCLLSEKYDTLLAEHQKSKDKIHKLEKSVETINNQLIRNY